MIQRYNQSFEKVNNTFQKEFFNVYAIKFDSMSSLKDVDIYLLIFYMVLILLEFLIKFCNVNLSQVVFYFFSSG